MTSEFLGELRIRIFSDKKLNPIGLFKEKLLCTQASLYSRRKDQRSLLFRGEFHALSPLN